MPSKNTLFLSSAIVLGLGAVAVSSAIVVSADQEGETHPCFGNGNRGEHREAAHEAMEAGDYGAWKEATKNSPHASEVTEEMFARMQEMHELREEGKYEESDKIREELGFPERHAGKHGKRHGGGNGSGVGYVQQ